MDLTSIQPVSTTAIASAGSQISSDFQTFLKLLTTQISNQDPLEPMKAEEFAVQLATFSSVEQQVATNELLTAMAESAAGGDFAAMTGWIGREVRAQMPVAFSGSPLSLDPEQPISGSRHELVARTPAGTEVDRMRIDASGDPVVWMGAGVPFGTYSFTVESSENGTLVASEPVFTYARVEEIRYSSGGPILGLTGGVELPASGVSAVREAK